MKKKIISHWSRTLALSTFWAGQFLLWRLFRPLCSICSISGLSPLGDGSMALPKLWSILQWRLTVYIQAKGTVEAWMSVDTWDAYLSQLYGFRKTALNFIARRALLVSLGAKNTFRWCYILNEATPKGFFHKNCLYFVLIIRVLWSLTPVNVLP